MKYRNYFIYPKYSEGDKVYYGNVSGVPEIEEIEAATLDDFERLFHDAVDDYLDDRRAHKSNKKARLIVTIVCIVALIVLALVTCPDKNKHLDVLKDRMSAVINEQVAVNENTSDLEAVGIALFNRLMGRMLDNYITVDDYALFSVGKSTIKGSENVVSFGIFGHVFTKSKEKMKQQLENSDELKLFKLKDSRN